MEFIQKCRPDVLIDKVNIQWHTSSASQVIFSTASSHYISPLETISQGQLVELLNKAGGSEGHAKLYLLPIQESLQTSVVPDLICFTPLSELSSLFLEVLCERFVCVQSIQ